MGAAMIERPHSKFFLPVGVTLYLPSLELPRYCSLIKDTPQIYHFVSSLILKAKKFSPLTYFLSEMFSIFPFRAHKNKVEFCDNMLIDSFFLFSGRPREMSQAVGDILWQESQQENIESL